MGVLASKWSDDFSRGLGVAADGGYHFQKMIFAFGLLPLRKCHGDFGGGQLVVGISIK